ncbi:MAG: noncanonical pyrimidine nucleotidase, YjjG family [Zetaproteobacteria bacterium]|nr:noncanonical pyrimidine nucleotidase, YjjG family [Zetaproteobacteria bacterium]
MKIKHIFFDLDHTLWDFETNSNQSFKYIFKQFDLKVDFEKFKSIYYPINENYWKRFRDNAITKEELRFGRLNDTFIKLNVRVNDALIVLLAEAYIDNLSNYNSLVDGALDILDYLKPKYAMHIITNGFEEIQGKKMKNSGLEPYFKTVITSEQVGVKKPNAKIFNFALTTCQAKADESVMIGDNYEADVMGALQCGLDAIFCNFNKEPSAENIKSVTQLVQLKQYL